MLAVGVACYGMVTITNAFLQAEGKTWHLLPSAVFGVIVKGACTYLLAGNARFATIAAPIGTVLCYLAIAVWNFAVLRVSLLPVPGLRELFARPFLVATLAVLCGMLWYRTACCFSIAEPVVTLSAVGITGLLYGLFLLLFQCVERQEIADILPRNVRREKIR